jgi:hypothetical protein
MYPCQHIAALLISTLLSTVLSIKVSRLTSRLTCATICEIEAKLEQDKLPPNSNSNTATMYISPDRILTADVCHIIANDNRYLSAFINDFVIVCNLFVIVAKASRASTS